MKRNLKKGINIGKEAPLGSGNLPIPTFPTFEETIDFWKNDLNQAIKKYRRKKRNEKIMKIFDDIILIVEYFTYCFIITFLIIFLIIPYVILIFSDTLKKRHKRDIYLYEKFKRVRKKITKLSYS